MNNKGQTLVVFIILLPFALFFIFYVIDKSYLTYQKKELESVAEVSLEIYKENEKIAIVIANTYNGKIEMEKLDNYGYTTKGKNHGVGLHLVKKIIENEVIYSQLRSLFEDYYVQKLIIDLSEIK